MPSDEHLFASPRPRRGPVEASLDRTLTAWRLEGHLTGPEHSAARAILRHLARNADRAERRVAAGEVSEYSFAMTVRQYRDALDTYAPRDRGTAAGIFADTSTIAAALADLD